MKNTINDEWMIWIKSQLSNNVPIETIKKKLQTQKYNSKLIDETIKSIEHNKYYSNFYVQNKGYYNIKIPDKTKLTSELEIGDYIPYFNISNESLTMDVSELCSKKYILCFSETIEEKEFEHIKTHFNNVEVYFFIDEECTFTSSNIFKNKSIYTLFKKPCNEINIYVINENSKIIKEIHTNKVNEIKWKLEKKKNIDPPITIIPNVLTDEMISFFNKKIETENTKHTNTQTKQRRDIQLDNDNVEMLDNKLSKSLFPELNKIYNLNVTFRETYKLSKYTGDDSGKFHMHRDTVFPYAHRRLAMVLVLNTNYEGGGIVFPEYSTKPVKPDKGSCIIFPGTLYHEVLPVTNGNRNVIISFLFGNETVEFKHNVSKLLNKPDQLKDYKINVSRNVYDMKINNIIPKPFVEI